MNPPVVHTLSRLVAHPTVSDQPVLALAAYLAERAEDAGFKVERFETEPGKLNLVARAGPDEGEGIVLSGHMDVVPTEGQDWSSDPFLLSEREGRLHGRGACDMKGFIAATVEAVERIPIQRASSPIALVWTHDEEVGCLGSQALVNTLKDRPHPLPRLAIIGEPTDFRICHQHPGHATFQVSCRGRPAHSSRPALGASAITVAQRALVALEQLSRRWAAGPTPHTILNVGTITGGTAVNIVPEHCSLHVGIRPVPGQPIPEIVAALEAALVPVQEEVSAWGATLSATLLQATPSLLTDPCCPLVADLAPHARAPEPVGVPFATDAGNLSALGIESIVFGPGSIDQAHRPDEFIEAADLFRATEMIESLLNQRCISP